MEITLEQIDIAPFVYFSGEGIEYTIRSREEDDWIEYYEDDKINKILFHKTFDTVEDLLIYLERQGIDINDFEQI